CLNVGCIPSKALLDSSELYRQAQVGLAAHGIKASGVALDLAAMMARKDKVVRGLTQGVAGLFKKNKVEWVAGTARLEQGRRVIVGERTPERKRIRLNSRRELTPSAGFRLHADIRPTGWNRTRLECCISLNPPAVYSL